MSGEINSSIVQRLFTMHRVMNNYIVIMLVTGIGYLLAIIRPKAHYSTITRNHTNTRGGQYQWQ